VTALPTAATVPPAAATYRRDAARADAGSGSVTWRQALPLAEIHAAGLAPAEPAATKPLPVDVTEASLLSLPVRDSTAGCHPASPAENQAFPARWPPPCRQPTMTSPLV